MYMKKITLILIAIILLGTALRFYGLAEESLWTDEIISLNHAQQPTFSKVIDSVIAIELTPPGYYLLLSQWIGSFGTSEFSLRFLPALFDIGSIILIFIIGKKLSSTRISLMGALIYATSMLPIVYAQEARHYSMFGFLALLSSLFLIYALQGKTWPWAAYMITQILAVSLSYTGAFVVLFHGIILLFTARTQLKKFLLAMMGIGILFLPQLPIAIQEAILRHSALQVALFQRGVPYILSQLGMFFYVLPAMLLAFVLATLLFAEKRYTPSQTFLARAPFIIMLAWGILHTVFLQQTLRSFALIRHSFFIVPFIYLTFAYGLDKLKSKKVWIAIVTAILLFNAGTLAIYYETTTKAPWREAISTLESQSLPNNIIFFDRAGANIDLYEYYATQPARAIPLTIWYNNGTFVETDTTALRQLLQDEQQFWFISSRDFRTEEKYLKFLDENYNRIEIKEYKELKVIRFSTHSAR
jgi:uncharacterized membrane protein